MSLPAEMYVGKIGLVTGWGTLKEDGKPSCILQEVEVPVLSNEHCISNTNYTSKMITDNMLCAGYPGVGARDSCQGDSGMISCGAGFGAKNETIHAFSGLIQLISVESSSLIVFFLASRWSTANRASGQALRTHRRCVLGKWVSCMKSRISAISSRTFLSSCARPFYPGVYTRITKFLGSFEHSMRH